MASDFFDAFAPLRHQLDGKSPPLVGTWLVYGGEPAEQRPQAGFCPGPKSVNSARLSPASHPPVSPMDSTEEAGGIQDAVSLKRRANNSAAAIISLKVGFAGMYSCCGWCFGQREQQVGNPSGIMEQVLAQSRKVTFGNLAQDTQHPFIDLVLTEIPQCLDIK